MNTSETINEIAAALAKAQAKISNPAKNRVNPHFKSKYADLADGLDVIRPVLAEAGVAFIQATEVVEDGVILRTRLIHSSGQWIESTYPVSKNAPHQQMGAALTYAKRQSLFALVGVCGDDDLDGEDSKDTPTNVRGKTAVPAQKGETFVRNVINEMKSYAKTPELLQEWYRKNRENIESLDKNERDAIIAACAAKRESFAKEAA